MITPWAWPVSTRGSEGILRIGFELERQAVVRVVLAADHGKAEGQQRDEQPALRDFETVPGRPVINAGQIGDDARQAARRAQLGAGLPVDGGTAQLHTCSSV